MVEYVIVWAQLSMLTPGVRRNHVIRLFSVVKVAFDNLYILTAVYILWQVSRPQFGREASSATVAPVLVVSAVVLRASWGRNDRWCWR